MDPYYYSNCICKTIYEVLEKRGGKKIGRGAFRNRVFQRKMAAAGLLLVTRLKNCLGTIFLYVIQVRAQKAICSN